MTLILASIFSTYMTILGFYTNEPCQKTMLTLTFLTLIPYPKFELCKVVEHMNLSSSKKCKIFVIWWWQDLRFPSILITLSSEPDDVKHPFVKNIFLLLKLLFFRFSHEFYFLQFWKIFSVVRGHSKNT